ncbi:MAG: hypothetical protein A3G81_29910 [Betaproteobacteria bacterium RIFCSPLOWO2_12_FULL_65_14]|nr:MAG: hypothetical protein A3G81_29910 [Betaproteobacteria bacterium RIFCSPLOWO2_12_FULL_65_14]
MIEHSQRKDRRRRERERVFLQKHAIARRRLGGIGYEGQGADLVGAVDVHAHVRLTLFFVGRQQTAARDAAQQEIGPCDLDDGYCNGGLRSAKVRDSTSGAAQKGKS